MRLTKKQKRTIVYSILGLLVFLLGSLLPATNQQETASADSPVSPTVVPSTVPGTREQAVVSRVIDGDTIDVDINGTIERIRMIGINTPETKDPRKPVECYGREASSFLTELVDGKPVELESDPSQGIRDRYDRLLRYVFLDGTNVNLEIIKQGYGYEYTYDTPYIYQTDFKQAQQEAEEAKRGLWGENGCEEPVN